MAVLQKIRQRSLLLILVIGFCLLAFIIGDIFNSGGFSSTSKDVGSIDGKDISQTNRNKDKENDPLFVENLIVHILVNGCFFSLNDRKLISQPR